MQIRAATYNIRHACGIDERVDLDRIAQVIAGLQADIIGLQEVDDGWSRSGMVDQARYLADQLGMQYVFGTAFSRGSSRFGNAVLSRYPIVFWDQFRLPSVKEPRTLVRTRIDLGGQDIEFCNVHLGLSVGERLGHINEIIIPTLESIWPLILVGDFNSRPDSPEALRLRTILADICPLKGYYTYPSSRPDERIDYIMVSGQISPVEAGVISSGASDHCPLAATLNIQTPPGFEPPGNQLNLQS